MDKQTINEILEVCGEPKRFHYYKDKHLLNALLLENKTHYKIADIKGSKASALLQKAWFKKAFMANSGSGIISRQDLLSYLPADAKHFNTTLGEWGEDANKHNKDKWYQTSRSGYSLVVQLNFCSEHNYRYFQLLKPQWRHAGVFNYAGHPVNKGKYYTMAWARVDVDFNTNEAIIEEIQTDWLRNLRQLIADVKENDKRISGDFLIRNGIGSSAQNLMAYYSFMRNYFEMWQEAILSLSIEVLQKEIGVEHIFMHTHESGNLFKEITYRQPPKSLYSKLPTKMGFVLNDEAPLFLNQEQYLKRYFKKAKKQNVKWFKYAV